MMALLAALCLWCGVPTGAQAQYPCGVNGPGPGEIVIGQTGGSQAHAPTLLCQYVGGDDVGGDESEPRREVPSEPMKPGYMAAAYHADTSSVWITVGHQSMDSAKERALEGCNNATRGGCYVAESFDSWGSISVSMDAMGQLWIKVAPFVKWQPNSPRFDVMRDDPAIKLCRQKSFGCEFLGFKPNGLMPEAADVSKSYVIDYFPSGALTQNNWALVARPEKTPTAALANKSWLISGKRGLAAARKDILDRCQADAGTACAISTYAVTDNPAAGPKVGGMLVHFVDSAGRNHWTSAVPPRTNKQQKKRRKGEPMRLPDRVAPQDRVDAACPSAAAPCRIIATYDAATPRATIVEDAR
jgi:hypothetical protein